MSMYENRRLEKLMERLRKRTHHDGTPLPGYEGNVASLRAEIAQMTEVDEDGD